jgi:Anthrax toxin lethal factor, N- and C-terminal domain
MRSAEPRRDARGGAPTVQGGEGVPGKRSLIESHYAAAPAWPRAPDPPEPAGAEPAAGEQIAPPEPAARPDAAAPAAPDPGQALRAAAAALVDIGGTADENDRQAVIAEMIKIPMAGLAALARAGKRVIVCRNSVTEVRADLRGVRPRGWPEGSGWDKVPGMNDPGGNRVIIATRDGRVPPYGDGHGAANLVLHEVGHGLDDAVGGGSATAEFQQARTADLAKLEPYLTQAGTAGLRETYAESFARFYAQNPDDATTYPNLHAYWASDPLARAAAGGR